MWPRVIPGPRPSEGRHLLTTVAVRGFGSLHAAPWDAAAVTAASSSSALPPAVPAQASAADTADARPDPPRLRGATRVASGAHPEPVEQTGSSAAGVLGCGSPERAPWPMTRAAAAPRHPLARQCVTARSSPRALASPLPTRQGRALAATKQLARPQIGRDYPLNLSISVSGGKETN